jgi:hypothetical protein
MDLLDHLRQEAGDQKTACREGVLATEGRVAQALLLARLPSSLKQSTAQPQLATAYFIIGIVKGHDFSRAERAGELRGFNP